MRKQKQRNVGTSTAKRSGSFFGSRRRDQVYLEREGDRQIERIIEAVETVPWSVALLQLAWTAGPVTFIAAQGGYYLGFGKLLPKENIAFFIAYTVIAGVIGIATKIGYSLMQGKRHEERERHLRTVIDRLPDLVSTVRDLSVASLGFDARKREAAAYVLRNSALDPESVRLAVADITENEWLARIVAQVEVFRRAGLQSRVRDLVEASATQMESALAEIEPAAPEVAATLKERLEGRVPSIKAGMPREKNFVERIFAAIEEENETLMTLRDVEEILTLAFELINGRDIPLLSFRYRGRWKLAKATDNLERERNNYRIAQARGFSRLKALATFLAESEDTRLTDVASGVGASALLPPVYETMDALSKRLGELCAGRGSRGTAGIRQLRDKHDALATALELYKAIRQAYAELGRQHLALIRARQRWQAVSSRSGESAPTLRTGYGHGGLRILERHIRLDDEDKIKLAQTLTGLLDELEFRRASRPGAREVGRRSPLTVERAKRLAIETALALESKIGLSRPEVQRALNSSNAALLAGIEPGWSAAAKAAFGAAAAREVHEELGRAAENLGAALVRHYHIELTDRAIDFLHDTYGASIETLRGLAETSEPEKTPPLCDLSVRPPLVPAPNPQWFRQLKRAESLLQSS